MHPDRIAGLRRQMAAAGLDCVVMYPSANWRYVCSFAPVANERLCLLLVTAEHTAIVLPNFDAEEMSASAPGALVSGWSDLEGPERTLERVWAQIGGSRLSSIAIDDGMPYLFTRMLLAVAQPMSQRLLTVSLPRYRLVKDAAEIEAIRTTATIIEKSIAAAAAALAPGLSERDLERIIKTELLAAGAETLDYTLVQFGASSAIPHHLAGDPVLAANGNVLLDIAVTHGQYFADITRNLSLGPPPGKYAEVSRSSGPLRPPGWPPPCRARPSMTSTRPAGTRSRPRASGRRSSPGPGTAWALRCTSRPRSWRATRWCWSRGWS